MGPLIPAPGPDVAGDDAIAPNQPCFLARYEIALASMPLLISGGRGKDPDGIDSAAGSLDPELLRRYGYPTAEALVESALRECAALEEHGFTDIKVSVKSADGMTCS